MEVLSQLWQFIWEWIGWLSLVFFAILPLLLRLLGLLVVPEQQKKRYAHSWLLLIFFVPILGWLLYWLIGSPKLSSQRRAQQQYMDEVIAQRVKEAERHSEMGELLAPSLPRQYAGIIQLNDKLGGLPAFSGNHIELLPNYMGAIERIAEMIDGAQRFVHVAYFMFADDEAGSVLVDALIRAQQRGVKARVLVDHVGNIQFNRPFV